MDMVYSNYITKKTAKQFFDVNANVPVFKHQNLKDQIDTYKLKNTPFDTTYHNIDDFMLDAYKTYYEFEDLLDESGDGLLKGMDFLKKGREEIFHNSIKLKTILNHIILNFDFVETEIRGIQYSFLHNLMTESIKNEEYETAAIVRDKLKKFNA
jgi:hypothetical protein